MSSSEETQSTEEQKSKILPWYQDVAGFRIPGAMSVDAHRSALTYKPHPEDVFIVSYPKCGTTWVQIIVAYIFRKGRSFTSAMDFFFQIPFLQMMGAQAAEMLSRPVAIKYHLPFYLMPWSPEAKYIFVARNPKDCCVSFYHHTKDQTSYRFEEGEFDDFFELFIEGKCDFGDYFDTLLSWYEHRNDPNVLFLTYEQLKKDTKTYVLKIAEFLGPQYKEALEKDEQIFQNVIQQSSMNSMRESLVKSFQELASTPVEQLMCNPDLPEGFKHLLQSGVFSSQPKIGNFVRKGIIGDWRNHFSPSQNARLENKFREKTAGTDLPELWKDDM